MEGSYFIAFRATRRGLLRERERVEEITRKTCDIVSYVPCSLVIARALGEKGNEKEREGALLLPGGLRENQKKRRELRERKGTGRGEGKARHDLPTSCEYS